MPTLTSKAIYQNGVVIPEIHPPLVPTEAVVIFIPKTERGLANGPFVLQALKKAKGILPKTFDGVKYENQIRKIASQEWNKRVKENNL